MKSLDKMLILLFLILLTPMSYAGSYLDWNIQKQRIIVDGKYKVDLRMGFLEANKETSFKGNVLYYQGLGDSMLNHDPLFEAVVKAGFRVVAFDYMGQGGSGGSMNNTTIRNITKIGDFVMKKLGKKNNAGQITYNIIGWSTGGLAAYKKANLDKGSKVKSIVLIAPGIAPNYLVGEGLFNWPVDEITMRTLTTNSFEGVNDPHEDPIHPNSPLFVPKFALNLQHQAKEARWFWKIPKNVKGLVLLSGPQDTYVNAAKTKKVLNRNASHFKVKSYEKALHEIDNEAEPIAKDVRSRIVNFLLK